MTTYSRPTDSQIFGASESAKYLEMLRKRFQLFLDCVPDMQFNAEHRAINFGSQEPAHTPDVVPAGNTGTTKRSTGQGL